MRPSRLLSAFALLLSLAACSRREPERYFFLNDDNRYYNYASIHAAFGPQDTCRLAVGQAILIYIFDSPLSYYKEMLQKHFAQAEQYGGTRPSGGTGGIRRSRAMTRPTAKTSNGTAGAANTPSGSAGSTGAARSGSPR